MKLQAVIVLPSPQSLVFTKCSETPFGRKIGIELTRTSSIKTRRGEVVTSVTNRPTCFREDNTCGTLHQKHITPTVATMKRDIIHMLVSFRIGDINNSEQGISFTELNALKYIESLL
jgi:hypothetical protein